MYAQLVRLSTVVAVLCTHDRTMFCRRVGNSLHFSKVYTCGDVSPSVVRVLAAVLLTTSKCTNVPTPDSVSFGQSKSLPPSRGPSRLLLSRRKIDVQPVWEYLSLFTNVSLYFLIAQTMSISPVITNHDIVPFTAIDSSRMSDLSTLGRLLDIWVGGVACVI